MAGKRIVIAEAKKLELFEKAYRFEELGADRRLDYFYCDSVSVRLSNYYMAEGAFEMLTILGLEHEYIRWANKRLHEFEAERSNEDE